MRSSRVIVVALLLCIVSKLDAYSATSLLPLVSPFRWGAAALHHHDPSKGRPGVLTPAGEKIGRGELSSLRCSGGGGSSSALLSSGGELASRSESMSVFKVKRRLREEKALDGGSEWIASIQDGDILRFVRARSRNVYGHEWRHQGEEGEAATVEGALMLILEHDAWRQSWGGHDDAADDGPSSSPSLAGIFEWRAAKNGGGNCENRDGEAGEGGSQPELHMDASQLTPNDVGAFLEAWRHACEEGRLNHGVPQSTTARFIVHLAPSDAAVPWRETFAYAVAQHVWDSIASRKLIAMAKQALNPVGIAQHPPAYSALELLPGYFSHVSVMCDHEAMQVLGPAWRIAKAAADAVPLIDCVASAFLLTRDARKRFVVADAARGGLDRDAHSGAPA